MTTAAAIAVAAAEVLAELPERDCRRLLGWPVGRPLSAELAHRARGARDWYAAHGRPFLATRRARVLDAQDGSTRLDSGHVLVSEQLCSRLGGAQARGLVVAAASAGVEVAHEARRLWADGRVDEAYFLDRLAAAVAEQLLMHATRTLCRDLAGGGEQPLAHLSPGCGQWALTEQQKLMQMLEGGSGGRCGPVRLLESGALDPPHSVLAVIGIAPGAQPPPDRADRCRGCDLDPCAYRRARYLPRGAPIPEAP